MTMNSARLTPIIDLPVTLHNREVEVIVLPQLEEPKGEKKSVESIKGILKHRANPALRELEKKAWEQAAVEKYLEKMKDDCA